MFTPVRCCRDARLHELVKTAAQINVRVDPLCEKMQANNFSIYLVLRYFLMLFVFNSQKMLSIKYLA